jgi:hypothetical protein
MLPLVTTRFNEFTWEENMLYRSKNNLNGGIYSVPSKMSPKIGLNDLVFIIEMNNTKNKVEGISLIKNFIETDKYYKVYSDANYNRYTYKTDYRIERNILEEYNIKLVNILDELLFKGKTHLKRGSGITTITEKFLRSPLCNGLNLSEEIKKIFIMHFDSKNI